MPFPMGKGHALFLQACESCCLCVIPVPMCKPIRDYLSVLRDYTREIITFGGFCLMCFVYNDFRQLAQDQARTSAHTVDVLRSMDARLATIEQHSITLKQPLP